MKKKFAAAGAVGALLVAGIGVGTWVAVADEGEATERGACTGTAYVLSVEEDDGGLELGFELQSSAPGEVWQVRVQQGDSLVLEGERTTDEDGELDLDTLVDEDGPSTYEVTVTPATGEPCVATLTR